MFVTKVTQDTGGIIPKTSGHQLTWTPPCYPWSPAVTTSTPQWGTRSISCSVPTLILTILAWSSPILTWYSHHLESLGLRERLALFVTKYILCPALAPVAVITVTMYIVTGAWHVSLCHDTSELLQSVSSASSHDCTWGPVMHLLMSTVLCNNVMFLKKIYNMIMADVCSCMAAMIFMSDMCWCSILSPWIKSGDQRAMSHLSQMQHPLAQLWRCEGCVTGVGVLMFLHSGSILWKLKRNWLFSILHASWMSPRFINRVK